MVQFLKKKKIKNNCGPQIFLDNISPTIILVFFFFFGLENNNLIWVCFIDSKTLALSPHSTDSPSNKQSKAANFKKQKLHSLSVAVAVVYIYI